MRTAGFVILFILSGLSGTICSQNKTRSLEEDWQFYFVPLRQWFQAEIPGNIYTDLYRHSLIPDPYFADNNEKLTWVDSLNWTYRCRFVLSDTEQASNSVVLLLPGVDTRAKIFINNTLILHCDNRFRIWEKEIKPFLHDGENVLKIEFESALLYGAIKAKAYNCILPEAERVFTRKAQYQFGWDFAPRFAACGLTEEPKLIFSNKARIRAVSVKATPRAADSALLKFVVHTACSKSGTYWMNIQSHEKRWDSLTYQGNRFKLDLVQGNHTDTFKMVMPNAKRWWCNGMGLQHIYTAELTLISANGSIDQKTLDYGIREIELVQEKDEKGRTFYFKLNGLPLYAKGSNLVPSDMFVLKKEMDTVLVKRASDLGMNMLRIWGGGVYGSEAFYESCDRNGILVWQDFMFAGAMYPLDKEFELTLRNEIQEQAERISSHPSLALFCGNNEIDEAWHNWGWQKKFGWSKKDSLKLWNDYNKLFHSDMPKTLHAIAPEIPYIPSSPELGWGHPESLLQGDSHFWAVWWGQKDFSAYKLNIARFHSEYGFQSLPDYFTLMSICAPEDFKMNSRSLLSHQKNSIGNKTIQRHMDALYGTSDSVHSYIYLSQLLQRDAMKMAIEAHRCAKPYNMGTLFWQFNDAWPAFSWSALDHNLRPKALYYELKRLYANYLITSTNKGDSIQICLVSDSALLEPGFLKAELKDFYGHSRWSISLPVNIQSQSGTKFSLPLLAQKLSDSADVYLKLDYTVSGRELAKTFHYFALPKNLHLPASQVSLNSYGNEYIEIKSSALVKDFYLYSQSNYLEFSENYFDLEAGETKRVKINKPAIPVDLKDLKYMTLNNLR
ncbi:MAG TPA: glycoside hydrolase family 2 protein [Bacteroidia bacterium]|nr:glycoside hydrolase family 2 protein [Bacteroidia bacterium]